MAKKASLADALRRSGATVGPAPQVEAELAEGAEDRGRPPSPPAARRTQPSRVGTVPITVHLPKDVRRQLKQLALDEERTVADLVAEALNLVFAKYRRAEVAPRK